MRSRATKSADRRRAIHGTIPSPSHLLSGLAAPPGGLRPALVMLLMCFWRPHSCLLCTIWEVASRTHKEAAACSLIPEAALALAVKLITSPPNDLGSASGFPSGEGFLESTPNPMSA